MRPCYGSWCQARHFTASLPRSSRLFIRTPKKRVVVALASLLAASGPVLLRAQTATLDFVGASAPPSAVAVAAHVSGRNQSTDGGMYRYQWPGVSFSVYFTGMDLYFTMAAGDQDLHVTEDGQSLPALVRRAAGTYRIRSTVAGPHTVHIDAVNENQDGPKSLGAFFVDATGHGTPAPPVSRQIEMIGDSHTVGYGNTSSTRECSTDQVWLSTDTSQSIGADLAAHYRADLQINAISGRGVVRNYNGFTADTVPVAHPYLFLDKATLYSDPAWHPSVVVVSLGTNDFSTALHPEEKWNSRDALHADFERTYAGFLQRLRERDPGALILVWATDIAAGEIETEAARVVQQRNDAGDARVFFVPMDGLAFTGCHSHPSVADDQTVANRLIPVINAHTPGW